MKCCRPLTKACAEQTERITFCSEAIDIDSGYCPAPSILKANTIKYIKPLKSIIVSSFLLLILVWGGPSTAGESSIIDSPLEITQAAFRQVSCMDENRYRFHKDTIRALSYTKMRALRAFCSLDIYADDAIAVLEKLAFYQITFDQVRSFEAFAKLDGITAATSWQLLDLTGDLGFTTMQTISAIANVQGLDGDTVIDFVQRVKKLDDTGNWAVKALFSIQGINRQTARTGLELIETMESEQQLSVEQSCLIPGMDNRTILKVLPLISSLSQQNAMNSKGLFGLEKTTPEQALDWLRHYFSLPQKSAETTYYELSKERQAMLLTSFAAASDYHIREINDLHAVTSGYGTEISTGALAAGGTEMVLKHFLALHPKAQNRYNKALQNAFKSGTTYEAISVLKQATALARTLTAKDLSSANIYILLSRGSELYDSSFRNILVPVLLSRINNGFNSNLLKFLERTDPDNGYVSDFIISCAQKGKLTTFFPNDSGEQRKILDLMAKSAFRDEQSLILFSATFATLLQKLEPAARTYLIQKMVSTIDQADSIFSLQLRVILQFYFDKHPELLSTTDVEIITKLVNRYGRVDLAVYTATDFSRWKSDGRLSSLSIFQQDDDGKISYLSNSRNLLKNGYKPRAAETISLLEKNSPIRKEAERLIARGQVSALYKLSVDTPLIVEYHKTVNGFELSHAVAVYHNKDTQRRLLKKYLTSGMEMFAQRGHSYWREGQLLEPMRQLLKSKEITHSTIPDINRFMSIGSCGGIRIYSEINRLFNNSVDIFATVGTGKAIVNDPYNQKLFEIIATSNDTLTWEEVAGRLTQIFADGRGSDYLQPGSLPAILHKMMDVGSLN